MGPWWGPSEFQEMLRVQREQNTRYETSAREWREWLQGREEVLAGERREWRDWLKHQEEQRDRGLLRAMAIFLLINILLVVLVLVVVLHH